MKLLIALVLFVLLFSLVRRNILRIDHSFPLFGAIVILGFASVSDRFIDQLAAGLGIVYAPLAIILLAIFFLLALVTVLVIVVSRMRYSQISLVRRLAGLEMDSQELMRSKPVSEKQTEASPSIHRDTN